MPTFREIRDAARSRVHERLKVTARCYTGAADAGSELVSCRVHTALTVGGDLPETGLAFAERVDVTPRLVFLKAEHRPARSNVYSLGDGEAYVVQRVESPDGITVTAVAEKFSESEAAQWPGP